MPILQNEKVFSYDPLHAREIAENYISPEGERGQFFVILESPLSPKVNQEPFIDELIHKAANFFDLLSQNDPEKLLEEILSKMNKYIPEMAAEIKIHNWLAGLAIGVGIIYQNKVYFSSFGHINALIIHRSQVTPLVDHKMPINPHKLFSDIFSGPLDDGDCLIVCTNSLLDYLSGEKIRQIVKQYSVQAAAKKIHSLLDSVPSFVTFNALLIKKPAITDQETVVIPKSRLETEQDFGASTENDFAEQKLAQLPLHTKPSFHPGEFKNANSLKKARGFFQAIALFFVLVYRVIKKIALSIKNTLLFIFSKKYRRRTEAEALNNINSIGQTKLNWWQELSLLKKISLIAMFILLLGLFQSLVFLTQRKAVEQVDHSYQDLLASANSKFSEADSKLIYQDEVAAEQILLDLQKSLQQFNAGTQEQKSQIDSLLEKTRQELNKVWRIHDVPLPTEIADLNNQLDASTAQKIHQFENVFYILTSDKLYQWSTDNLQELGTFDQGRLMADWSDAKKILLAGASNLSIFDPATKSIQAVTLNTASNNQNIQDIAVYGSNLYVLDKQAKQIFRYPKKGDSFGDGQAWLKNDIDLSQSNSLAIDGDLFVIDNQGLIKKFTKGELQEFNYHQPRPNIGSGAIIKTFRDSPNLYILDPQNQRVIILSKTGDIVDQFSSPKFKSLSDMAVDPAEKAIYLLSQNHLYILPIKQ